MLRRRTPRNDTFKNRTDREIQDDLLENYIFSITMAY